VKSAFSLTLTAFIIGCQEKDPTPEFQKELFSYITKNQNPTAPKCDPSFAKLRNDELTVFCQPLPNPPEENQSEFREMVKSETTSLIIKWGNESNCKLNSILTRFTDEIIAEGKK
jgi:hypothetical protein